jgi:hypothetical protein
MFMHWLNDAFLLRSSTDGSTTVLKRLNEEAMEYGSIQQCSAICCPSYQLSLLYLLAIARCLPDDVRMQ